MTIRKQLINLGSSKLADTLLELAGHSEEAAEMVARLVVSGDEKVARFKARLAAPKKGGDFYDWRQVGAFSRELTGLLADLAKSTKDAKSGAELAALFFEYDRYIFESCDDSSGEIVDIFREDGTLLFSGFAADYPDKKIIFKM